MSDKTIARGVYPTMVTPYKNNEIDEEAARALVEWYIQRGCRGVFAVCQSSEMFFLSLEERVRLARLVVEAAAGRLCVVASGHISESFEEQAREIDAVAATGVDAVVLVSNRFDLHGDGDDVWIANAERVLGQVDPSIRFGIYECPHHYKRLLTPKILDWCLKDGRFRFIKDTCSDPVTLKNRLDQLQGTEILLFNANEQTLLDTLRGGAAGYSGVMANFHPDIEAWLCENYDKAPEKAELVENILCMTAFTESLAYPCTAKYYLNKIGVPMSVEARSRDCRQLNAYNKACVDRLFALDEWVRNEVIK
ncbi:MAG: dihydrodipicolinate synthase family protein [Clostridia bacterium]|nr:dihydrodipicolinate synthase family protein [Clostridia bacterium]